MGTWHKTSCMCCAQNCGLEVEVENNRMVKVKPDKANPRSEGYVCRKGLKVAHYQHHADRLQQPAQARRERLPGNILGSGPGRDRSENSGRSWTSTVPDRSLTWEAAARHATSRRHSVCGFFEGWGRSIITALLRKSSPACSGCTAGLSAGSMSSVSLTSTKRMCWCPWDGMGG